MWGVLCWMSLATAQVVEGSDPLPTTPERAEPAAQETEAPTGETGETVSEEEGATSNAVTFTFSGGVSLGSYQAGYAWTQLALLREEDATLHAIAGASAGNVNTLLAAMDWCRASPSDVVLNPFFDMWVHIGLDDLMGPYMAPTRLLEYEEDDGLLMWGAFRPIEKHLERQLTMKSLYGPFTSDEGKSTRCKEELSLALALTKAESLQVSDDMPIHTQRVIAAWQAKTTESGLTFTPMPAEQSNERQQRATPVGELLEWNPEATDIEHLLKLGRASGAFPGAFGPIFIDGSLVTNDRHTGLYLDGGLFDNIPLSATAFLSDYDSTYQHRYIAFDAAPGEQPTESPKDKGEPPRSAKRINNTYPYLNGKQRGLNYLWDLAGDAVQAARTHELAFLRRSNREIVPRVSRRSSHLLAGEMLGHFSAFIDEDLRLHDYFAGVFDGASDHCRWRHDNPVESPEDDPEAYVTCMEESAKLLFRDLTQTNGSQQVRESMDRALGCQHDRRLRQWPPHQPVPVEPDADRRSATLKALRAAGRHMFLVHLGEWADAQGRGDLVLHSRKKPDDGVGRHLFQVRDALESTRTDASPLDQFERFMVALRTEQYFPQPGRLHMRAAMANPRAWLAQLATAMLNRQREIERIDEARDFHRGGRLMVVDVAQYGVRHFMHSARPTSIPTSRELFPRDRGWMWAARIAIPSYAGTGMGFPAKLLPVDGELVCEDPDAPSCRPIADDTVPLNGTNLRWTLSTMYGGRKQRGSWSIGHAMNFKYTGVNRHFVGAHLTYKHRIPTTWVTGVRLSAIGGHHWGAIGKAPEELMFWDAGPQLQLDGLAGLVGIQVGSTGVFNPHPNRDNIGLDSLYFGVGINDLNGLVYWLAR